MLTFLATSCSIIAGIMSCFLFFHVLSLKDKRKVKVLLFWACTFLASSFTMLEYAFWLEGYNMFELTLKSFPLLVYFLVWFIFVIWNFERIKERRIWLSLLFLLLVWILIATSCLNCLR